MTERKIRPVRSRLPHPLRCARENYWPNDQCNRPTGQEPLASVTRMDGEAFHVDTGFGNDRRAVFFGGP